METVTLEVPESQVIQWVHQLSPQSKQRLLRLLIPQLDDIGSVVDYGRQRIREACSRRGVDWDALSEDERDQLVDQLLHGT